MTAREARREPPGPSGRPDIRSTRFARAHVLWWPWRSRPTVYLPRGLDPPSRERILRHEGVHVRQWEALGRIRFLALYLTDVWASVAAIGAGWAVTPWLLLALPLTALARPVKAGRLGLEAEAFAESAAWWIERGAATPITPSGQTDPIGAYAQALHGSYGLGPLVSRARCRAAIERWMPAAGAAAPGSGGDPD